MSPQPPSDVAEIRTRRIAVIDQDKNERIIAEIVNGQATLRVHPEPAGHGQTAAVLYGACDDGTRSPAVGLQLWGEGNAYVEVNLWKEGDRWQWDISTEDPNSTLGAAG